MASLQIQENVSLAPFTTLGVGGPARFFAHVRSEHELVEAVAFAERNRLPIFALGGGSNLLVHDAGFNGLILHLDLTGPTIVTPAGPTAEHTVSAGTPWDDFVTAACEQNRSGVECLAGIPGLTGGTPVQNVGAYGQEVAQTIRRVRAFDLQTHTFTQLAAADCRFTYRSSVFNTSARGRYLITAVTFALSPDLRLELTYTDLQRHFGSGVAPTPLEIARAVREIRRAKGMLLVPGDPDTRSAGSFFKNPIVPRERLTPIAAQLQLDPSAIPHWPAPHEQGTDRIKLPAAWLIERAGFSKGFTLGRAGISSRHSLALINHGGATAAEILALRDLIRSEVLARFAIRLEQEPIELGAPGGLTRDPEPVAQT